MLIESTANLFLLPTGPLVSPILQRNAEGNAEDVLRAPTNRTNKRFTRATLFIDPVNTYGRGREIGFVVAVTSVDRSAGFVQYHGRVIGLTGKIAHKLKNVAVGVVVNRHRDG